MQHLLILLYLLLERDLEIFRLARSTILHKDELWDSANTLEWVYRAVDDRHRDLESAYVTRRLSRWMCPHTFDIPDLFKQQNRDPAEQFKVFAFELVCSRTSCNVTG